MYDRIKDRPPLYRIYSDTLKEAGLIGDGEVDRIAGGIEKCMEIAYTAAHDKTCTMPEERFFEVWEGVSGRYSFEPVETGVDAGALLDISRRLNTFPSGFSVHPRLTRILNRRVDTVEAGEGIDWATAESLAFASCSPRDAGSPERPGQQPGTFSQRHGVLST